MVKHQRLFNHIYPQKQKSKENKTTIKLFKVKNKNDFISIYVKKLKCKAKIHLKLARGMSSPRVNLKVKTICNFCQL